MNSAYSAIASVPGAYVPPNQTGYFQTVSIRGGDYDQVGYEFDGVPVNRSFDNYPSSSASSLGNAEVQVYTGANPANSEGQGLVGLHQPGHQDRHVSRLRRRRSSESARRPFYHRATVEVGGATPDRLFSYYVGVAGYNQDFNYVDNQNGSTYDNWVGAPIALRRTSATHPRQLLVGAPAPWSYFMGPFNYALLSNISARDVVANFHIGIPHKNDAGRDDVQLLWDSESLHNNFYSTTNDIASTRELPADLRPVRSAPTRSGSVTPVYIDGSADNCQGPSARRSRGQLDGSGQSCVGTYYFPNSHEPYRAVPADSEYGERHDLEQPRDREAAVHQELRLDRVLALYGYTYYSDWLQNGPQSTYADYAGCCSPDYELSSHTRGISVQFQDQINAQNLVSAQASYVTANSIRDNNTQMSTRGARSTRRSSSTQPIRTADCCYGPARRARSLR